MIIREWRGRAAKSNANAYPKHFPTIVVPELQQVPGFLGAHLSQRSVNDKIEYSADEVGLDGRYPRLRG